MSAILRREKTLDCRETLPAVFSALATYYGEGDAHEFAQCESTTCEKSTPTTEDRQVSNFELLRMGAGEND